MLKLALLVELSGSGFSLRLVSFFSSILLSSLLLALLFSLFFTSLRRLLLFNFSSSCFLVSVCGCSVVLSGYGGGIDQVGVGQGGGVTSNVLVGFFTFSGR